MKKIIYIPMAITAILGTQIIVAQTNFVSSSPSTYSNALVISDEDMEACVTLYYHVIKSNNAYMVNQFNKNCAGKQSKSVYEDTLLNKQLEHISDFIIPTLSMGKS